MQANANNLFQHLQKIFHFFIMSDLSTPDNVFTEAKKVLHIAARMDNEKQYNQAIDNYIIGISHLMKYLGIYLLIFFENDHLI